MKHPAELTYAAIRLNHVTRRYLFCRTEEKPHFGDLSFDFMGYFGFGSGEYSGEHPPIFDGLRVRTMVLADASQGVQLAWLNNWFNEQTPDLRAFYTTDGKTFHLMIQDDEGVLLTHLAALNWHYYTNIGGDRSTAYSHIMTMNRRHFLFETYDEQDSLLATYAELAKGL